MNPLQRRLFQLHYEAPEDGGGSPSPVPGTENEVPPGSDPSPPAGAQNSDNGGDPGPVPYSRFKEVNDARRDLETEIAPIRELEQLGYSPDDFRRLAAWENEYAQDPVGWALQNALEQATDAGVKAQIEAAIQAKDGGSAETPPAPADQTPAAGDEAEPPAWAKPLIERHLESERAQEAQARSEAYDSITAAWKQLDEKDGIKSPGDAALATWIYAAAAQNAEPVDVLRAARQGWLAEREALLAEAVTPAREGDALPRAVPGSGAGDPLARVPERPRTLDQARKLAEEADARGTLTFDPTV